MRAVLRDNAWLTVRIAPGDQVLAKQPNAKRPTIRLQLPGVNSREPVAPHELPHCGTGAYVAQERGIFSRQHLALLQFICPDSTPASHAYCRSRKRRVGRGSRQLNGNE